MLDAILVCKELSGKYRLDKLEVRYVMVCEPGASYLSLITSINSAGYLLFGARFTPLKVVSLQQTGDH